MIDSTPPIKMGIKQAQKCLDVSKNEEIKSHLPFSKDVAKPLHGGLH